MIEATVIKFPSMTIEQRVREFATTAKGFDKATNDIVEELVGIIEDGGWDELTREFGDLNGRWRPIGDAATDFVVRLYVLDGWSTTRIGNLLGISRKQVDILVGNFTIENPGVIPEFKTNSRGQKVATIAAKPKEVEPEPKPEEPQQDSPKPKRGPHIPDAKRASRLHDSLDGIRYGFEMFVSETQGGLDDSVTPELANQMRIDLDKMTRAAAAVRKLLKERASQ